MGTHNHNFTQQFEFSGKARTWSLIAILIGLLAIAVGLLTGQPVRTFASLLLMAYYFTCVCAAGLFFVAVTYVSQSGWPTTFIRIPEAFAKVLPVASVILLLVCVSGLFTHNLYNHWYEEGITEVGSPNYDPIIAGKSGFLNVPFFLTRMVVLLGVYSIFAMIITKFSEREDLEGGLNSLNKNLKYSTIFLIIFGFTSPIWAFDTIMSLEAHWFSTMFGWYNFAGMWVSGLAAITLALILLRKAGYFSWVTENHLHDLGKYIFAFSIFWAYIWFAQFLLIYYANIPEESVYFYKRWEPPYYALFWVNIIINFVAPILILMSRDSKRKTGLMTFMCILLLIGHWIDFYLMVMPGTVQEHPGLGIVEIGVTLGFTGLFSFLMLTHLSKKALVPANNPFLEESLHHHI